MFLNKKEVLLFPVNPVTPRVSCLIHEFLSLLHHQCTFSPQKTK